MKVTAGKVNTTTTYIAMTENSISSTIDSAGSVISMVPEKKTTAAKGKYNHSIKKMYIMIAS